ncbi:MAG: hypothetical protein HYX52_06465 [Chloroflexi bacterium]|nr:hypothetical protein [Chloroflexota bacterium]
MTTKERLLDLVDQLDEAEVDELLDYAGWLAQEIDTLTSKELARVQAGEAEIARGACTTLQDLRGRLGL